MAQIPTNQSKKSRYMSVGVATSAGVYVGGKRLAPKQGDYTGGVTVIKTNTGLACVMRMPGLVVSQ